MSLQLQTLVDEVFSATEADRIAVSLVAAAAVMARLRDPNRGCAWDLAQTFETIAPYTIEEAYEVADAIRRGATGELRLELGDLLFQVLFHARLAQEDGAFDLAAVADGLSAKMVARHPHVFDRTPNRTADEQSMAWEDAKEVERRAANREASALDGVALALPALLRAAKLTKRAARIGFDWPDAAAVLIKLDEELGELNAAREENDKAKVHEEMGDLLFVVANLARKLEVDPEAALRDANAKFERRFRHVETRARDTHPEGGAPLDTLEAYWNEAKRAERTER